MESQSIIINATTTVRIDTYANKLANTRVTICQSSYGEEGVFYPAQYVTVFGEGIAKLRAALNELSPD